MHHQRVGLSFHHAVDAAGAVRPADIIFPEHQPRVAVDLTGCDAFNERHTASINEWRERLLSPPWGLRTPQLFRLCDELKSNLFAGQ